MNGLILFGIAVGLAMDAFAVSIAAGLAVARVTPRHVFRLAFHFGLFQFLMPILGWLAGRGLASQFILYDRWAAFGLLSLVGGKMLFEAFGKEKTDAKIDPTRGIMLVTLSVATSLDALAVGLSMAIMGVSVWGPSVVIGLVAAALSGIGIAFGSRLGRQVGPIAEIGGGCLLLLIGVRILVFK